MKRDDTISRQAAIDALDKIFDSVPMEQTTEILTLRRVLRELPSAQPERKKGKWIYGEDDGQDGWYCTEDSINHNTVRLIEENSIPWEMYEQDDNADHQRLITLGYIDGVLAMAKCMKEVLKE